MKQTITTGLLSFALLFSLACERNAKKEDSVKVAEERTEERMDSTARGDEKIDQATFMIEAASGGMMEVALGRMAEKQASHAEVKAFGKMMVTDHTKANEELKKLAAAKNVTLPASVGEEHQKHIDKLSGLKGAEFDREYMRLMVDDHQEDVDNFRKAAQDTETDPDVKAFATKTLTVLEKHLERARKVNDMVKNTK
ncbi:DUF4142 domain-containing protein [Adhaeribacter soli]|uniref:DUF4142 domain-containing protein n=1 Tax=Adhaeribacter soli TaxID=2607655 RepID=A0A5N1J118_9BACT|nr:DUF4142 domain-containing protein [Adhaeribacter soli]KAA9340191.1 DUF4142 domain-containing protein [Adhaeribacter soli]